jgi:hypothetical protein
MSQRSYSNDRYRKDANVGSTRKSAAKAKPIRKQGSTLAREVSKTKPKRGPNTDWMGLPTSPEIKKWRRIWWALLLGGLVLVGIGYLQPLRSNAMVQTGILVLVLALAGVAIHIDLKVIRPLRDELIKPSTGKKKATS